MAKLAHILLFCLLYSPALLWAEAAKAPAKPAFTAPEPMSFGGVLNMLLGLLVVIALILGLAWVMRKYGRLPMSNQVDMKVLGGLSLGSREKAVLVQVEGQRLLLGVSPGRVATLHVLDSADENPGFEKQLDQAMDQQS